MSADEGVSKLPRYEALFQLSGKILPLADILEIGAVFASGLKYVADVYSWRYFSIEDETDTTSQNSSVRIVIDGYRGKAVVSHPSPEDTSALEQDLRRTQRPVLLQEDELAKAQQLLPTQFQDPTISQIYVHPQFGSNTLQGIFLCSTRDKPFDDLDLKFITLASLLFHRKVYQARIEHRLFDALEKKLTALRRIREMENQLRVQDKMATLGRLVAGVAHEINTPLAAIQSSQDTLARAVRKLRRAVETNSSEGVSVDRPISSLVNVMESAEQAMMAGTERISRIVQSLTNFVRLDEAEFQMADPRQGIESVLSLLQAQIGSRITVVRNYGDVSPLYCSPGRLNQVFMHLIQHAIDTTEGEGELEIKTFQDDNNVYVEIKDTGTGMPPEVLQRAFDVGFSKADSRVQMGFGLSLDYKIIEQHGGSMKLESEAGDGTTVTISLPRTKARAGDLQSKQSTEKRN